MTVSFDFVDEVLGFALASVAELNIKKKRHCENDKTHNIINKLGVTLIS